MSHAREVLIAVDQLLNALLGGYASETMSARLHRLRAYPPYKTIQPLVDRVLRRWDPDHCQSSYQAIVDRVHLPQEYRDAESINP